MHNNTCTNAHLMDDIHQRIRNYFKTEFIKVKIYYHGVARELFALSRKQSAPVSTVTFCRSRRRVAPAIIVHVPRVPTMRAHLALKLALISITAYPLLHRQPSAPHVDLHGSATITMIKRFLWFCYSFAGVDYSWFFRMQYDNGFVCSGHLNFMNFIQLCCLHTDDASIWLIVYILVDISADYLFIRTPLASFLICTYLGKLCIIDLK